MSNYRPISLLSSFSKNFEKVIFNRIKHHIDANNILAQEQYGFRTKSSTEVATYILINNALLALDGKLSLGGLFCDLAKAFDSVNHIVLLSKFEFYGINGSIGKMIKSYLNDRYQRTLVNSNYSLGVSDWQKVKQGLQQGSILSPLLFLLYINDLPYLINKISKPILYADDTSILRSNSDMVEHEKVLKTILDKINKWFVVNSLSLNFNKTNYLHFSSISNIKSNINVNYGNIQINSTCNIKFLGLIIDSSLSWKDHINHLVTKLSATSYSIRILSVVLTQESLKTIYFAYVHSVMSYGIIFWDNSTYSNKIFKIQK
jgi:hypothetical protein